MQGCCFQDIENVDHSTLADPVLKCDHEAIVKVELAGLCGSDLHPFFGRERGIDPGTVMGHEFVGRIVETGSRLQRFQVGDRVCAPFTSNCGDCHFCRIGLTARCMHSQLFGWRENKVGLHGGQAEYVLVPNADATLVKAGSFSNEAALLLGDNLSTGYFAAELAEVKPDGVYVVIGCGTVGLLAIVSALRMGARSVIAHDPVPQRRRLAENLGAITREDTAGVISEVRTRTDSCGADGVMELVGLLPAQRLAYDAVRPGGVISTIGCHCTEGFGFSPVDAYNKNLTYRSGRCSARNYMDRLQSELADWQLPLEELITHRFGLVDCRKAYDTFAHRREGCIKAVLEMS